ncbi:hypothetical protein D9615_003874 [Tricholomella constricta]|uniref:FUN14 family protein n=1 Tax=Tricholomella constricta TaxID=117010 RepID=A0A8H5HCE0_9AGAR|nr:hypothetical protein D9615_003874 [Tricholomella constricta]
MSCYSSFLARGLRTRCPRYELPSVRVLHARSRFYSTSRLSFPFRPGPSVNGRPMQRSAAPLLFKMAGVAGIGLGISKSIPEVHCDETTRPAVPTSPPLYPSPPASSVSLYQLSFGTLSGICAGVFIKKGAKAAAWFLGGIFVLLQYLGSTSVVRVDWGRAASRFENAFYTTDATGSKAAPTIVSLWTWLLNFLTADFQPRASFIAGLVLGLRIG